MHFQSLRFKQYKFTSKAHFFKLCSAEPYRIFQRLHKQSTTMQWVGWKGAGLQQFWFPVLTSCHLGPHGCGNECCKTREAGAFTSYTSDTKRKQPSSEAEWGYSFLPKAEINKTPTFITNPPAELTPHMLKSHSSSMPWFIRRDRSRTWAIFINNWDCSQVVLTWKEAPQVAYM